MERHELNDDKNYSLYLNGLKIVTWKRTADYNMGISDKHKVYYVQNSTKRVLSACMNVEMCATLLVIR